MQQTSAPENGLATAFYCDSATPADLPAVLRIWAVGMRQLYPELALTAEHQRRFRRNFRQQRDPFGFWVARGAAGEVLGWCSILPAFSHPLKQHAEAEVSTYVAPNGPARGVGTGLMQHVFAALTGTDLLRVWGFAHPANARSIRMCEKAGMQLCGATPSKTILVKEYSQGFY